MIFRGSDTRGSDPRDDESVVYDGNQSKVKPDDADESPAQKNQKVVAKMEEPEVVGAGHNAIFTNKPIIDESLEIQQQQVIQF